MHVMQGVLFGMGLDGVSEVQCLQPPTKSVFLVKSAKNGSVILGRKRDSIDLEVFACLVKSHAHGTINIH